MSDDDSGADSGAETAEKDDASTSTSDKADEQRESDLGEGADRGRGLNAKAGDAFDALARETYEHGRELLDPTTVVAGRDAHVTIRTHLLFGDGQPRSRRPGRMRDDDLDKIRRRYIGPPDYGELRAFLLSSHLLVLTGQAATGRTTTALHLLDDVTEGRVSRLDPSAPVTDLAESEIEAGNGYLAQVGDNQARFSAVDADRLTDVLQRTSAYAVLVVGDHTDAARQLAAYGAPVVPPDPLELIARHVDADLPADAPSDRPERLLALARSPRLRKALGPQPRTDEAAGLAQLLLAHEDAEAAVPEIEAALAGFLDAQVAEWFSVLDGTSHGERGERARRLSALRIAMAVFDSLPSHIAMRAAEALTEKMTMPFGQPIATAGPAKPVPLASRPRALTAEDDRTLLSSTRLVHERRTVTFRGSDVPADVLRFVDPRTPSAVLRHVWQQRPVLRGPLVAWLDELAGDPRLAVRVRAAQAAGLLCSVDFSHVFTELIEPAAGATAPRRRPRLTDGSGEDGDAFDEDNGDSWLRKREFAALALDHVARDPLVRKAVTKRLKAWRRSDDPALRWTAATAWGYDIGHTGLESTLDELRVLGTPDEMQDLQAIEHKPVQKDWFKLLLAAGLGVARLFGTGAHEPILRKLDGWITHPRISLRKLAVQSVILMAGMPVSFLGRARHVDDDELPLAKGIPAERLRWPVLLALQDRHPEVVEPGAELVLKALRSPWRDVVCEVIADWFDSAADDEALLAEVEAFLPRIVVEEKDRARLRGLIRRQRRLWADPLPADTANRLDRCLASVPVVPRGGRVLYL